MSKQNPKDRLYSRDHEWIKDNGKGTVVVGITDYAQEMLTDIVIRISDMYSPVTCVECPCRT